MFDLGYLGVDQLLPAVLPVRRRPHMDLTEDERNFNLHLGTHRIIIENFYGRLKSYWKILGDEYRGDIGFLKDVVVVCVALTNILIMAYPLRREREFDNPISFISDGQEWANACSFHGLEDAPHPQIIRIPPALHRPDPIQQPQHQPYRRQRQRRRVSDPIFRPTPDENALPAPQPQAYVSQGLDYLLSALYTL